MGGGKADLRDTMRVGYDVGFETAIMTIPEMVERQRPIPPSVREQLPPQYMQAPEPQAASSSQTPQIQVPNSGPGPPTSPHDFDPQNFQSANFTFSAGAATREFNKDLERFTRASDEREAERKPPGRQDAPQPQAASSSQQAAAPPIPNPAYNFNPAEGSRTDSRYQDRLLKEAEILGVQQAQDAEVLGVRRTRS